MAKLIRALCDPCAKQYAEMFAMKPYPGRATTEKKTFCEACRRKMHSDCLRQYVISGKRGK